MPLGCLDFHVRPWAAVHEARISVEEEEALKPAAWHMLRFSSDSFASLPYAIVPATPSQVVAADSCAHPAAACELAYAPAPELVAATGLVAFAIVACCALPVSVDGLAPVLFAPGAAVACTVAAAVASVACVHEIELLPDEQLELETSCLYEMLEHVERNRKPAIAALAWRAVAAAAANLIGTAPTCFFRPVTNSGSLAACWRGLGISAALPSLPEPCGNWPVAPGKPAAAAAVVADDATVAAAGAVPVAP